MLHPGSGRVGMLGLPWMLMSQVLLPLGGMLAVVPLLRLVWRPLQLLAVVGSVARWLSGEGEHWRRVRRLNSVIVPPVGVSRVACRK